MPKAQESQAQGNRLYPKKPAGMHWLGYNDAVSWLNENSNISAYNQF